MTNPSTPPPPGSTFSDRLFELAKLYVMSSSSSALSGVFITAGIFLLGPKIPAAAAAVETLFRILGFHFQTPPQNQWVSALGYIFLVAGLLIGLCSFIGPKIKPVIQLIVLQSYQPISTAEIRKVIDPKSESWTLLCEVDFRENDKKSNSGLLLTIRKFHWRISKLNQNRRLFFCGIIHVPLAWYAGFLLRNFPARFVEIDHVTRVPRLLGSNGKRASISCVTSAAGSRNKISDQLLLISSSFQIREDQIPQSLRGFVQNRIDFRPTDPSSIQSAEDLHFCVNAVRSKLSTIQSSSPETTRVHILYAGINSLAFNLGQTLSENTDCEIIVYHHDFKQGYTWGISINRGGKLVRL